MPMIDVTMPEGALTAEAKAELADQLTADLIKGEGAPDNGYVRAISWCFFDERPAGAIHVGGAAVSRPIYRVVLTVPEGAPAVHGPLMLASRDALVRTVTEHVLAAEGTPYSDAEATRVWVQFREIKEGYWGGIGMIVRMEDIAAVSGALVTERGARGRAAIDAAKNALEPVG